jgi:hypothetical protein
MVSRGELPGTGFVKQEESPLVPFLQTGNGALFGALDGSNSGET